MIGKNVGHAEKQYDPSAEGEKRSHVTVPRDQTGGAAKRHRIKKNP